jgi:hypothetical protein
MQAQIPVADLGPRAGTGAGIVFPFPLTLPRNSSYIVDMILLHVKEWELMSQGGLGYERKESIGNIRI